MAVTPNYSWPIPVATDYVKDGWDAIADLGNAIDTTVAGLGSGLTKIATNTFSAQSTISFNNCFSSTYKHYRILTTIVSPSGALSQLFRFRASGSDNTTSNYNCASLRYTATGVQNFAANTQSDNKFYLSDVGTTYIQQSIDIFNPFASQVTRFSGTGQGTYTGVSDCTTFSLGGLFNATTSFDGFTIYPSSSTFSGTITVYGYQD